MFMNYLGLWNDIRTQAPECVTLMAYVIYVRPDQNRNITVMKSAGFVWLTITNCRDVAFQNLGLVQIWMRCLGWLFERIRGG